MLMNMSLPAPLLDEIKAAAGRDGVAASEVIRRRIAWEALCAGREPHQIEAERHQCNGKQRRFRVRLSADLTALAGTCAHACMVSRNVWLAWALDEWEKNDTTAFVLTACASVWHTPVREELSKKYRAINWDSCYDSYPISPGTPLYDKVKEIIAWVKLSCTDLPPRRPCPVCQRGGSC